MARTGIRLGEALALEWPDLDLNGRVARIARSRSDDGSRVDLPKSGHGRTIDLSRQLVAILERLSVIQKAETLRLGRRDLPAVVFASTAGTAFDAANVRHAFARVLRYAELPSHFTPYCLRHTYASVLISEGRSPASQNQARKKAGGSDGK